jgi:GT2 family glycosyltransferase
MTRRGPDRAGESDGAAGPEVAIVICNHNTAPELGACLRSLAAGGLADTRAEVWVADNASTDGSAALVAKEFPWVRLLRAPGNLGFAAGNNLALRAAGFGGPAASGARHALLLNPDTIVPPGAIRAMLDLLEAEPDIGALGPKLLLADGRLDVACRRSFPTPEVSFYRFSGLARLFPKSRRFGRYNLTYLDPDQPADVDSVVGACMLVRGAALADVGLLDERFWMYGEDLDWALRLRKAGWRVVYRPAVVVHHLKRAASSGSARARFEFQRAMWLFFEKHYARTTAWPMRLAVAVAIGLRGGPNLIREMRRGV